MIEIKKEKHLKVALSRDRALIAAEVDACAQTPAAPQHPQGRHHRPNQDVLETIPQNTMRPMGPNLSSHPS